MILLEPGNRIIEETVKAVIQNRKEKPNNADVRLYDFDDISYHIQYDGKKNPDFLKISMAASAFKEFEDYGGKAAIAKHYTGCFSVDDTDESGSEVALKVDLTKIQDGEEDTVIEKLACMRANIMGGLFEYYIEDIEASADKEPKKFNLRSDTKVFFVPRKDRCVIIFAIDFNEGVDKTIAKVFLQEFQDARRNLGGNAPHCSWSRDPPSELVDNFDIKENPGILGYISFAIMPGKDTKSRVHVLQSFRSYLQYHIKCSKTLFHSRMRARIKSLLQVSVCSLWW